MKSKLFLASALILAACIGFTLALSLRDTHAALPARVNGTPLPSLAPMLEQVMPAVVNVHTTSRVEVRSPFFQDPFFRFFFDLPQVPRERVQRSLGSGVIVDADQGYVLTNHHVIRGADAIAVALLDGRSFEAKLLGADPETDLALLQIPAQNLHALSLADSSTLRVGDFVVAVGNPFGLGQSVTSGIVSGLGRHGIGGAGFQNFIQTDAPINPGNSGGALVNLDGELVGINTAIVSPSGGNIGIGFAIPANMAREVTEQLIAHGEVRRGTLGLDAQSLTPELARALELENVHGAVITRIQPGSPAAVAGLKPGDVVLAVNGVAIDDSNDLHNALGLLPVGDEVRLQLSRDGEPLAVSTEIALPENIQVAASQFDPRLAGATLGELSAQWQQRGLTHGVAVAAVAPDSAAWHQGLRGGDIILSVNRQGVRDLADLQGMLEQSPPRILLNILRGRRAFFLLIE